MIKKTNTTAGQVGVRDDSNSKLPPDPVAPQIQDEESDEYFRQMGDNNQFAKQRVSDDMEGDSDDAEQDDQVSNEDIVRVVDENQDAID